ncbi:MAG: MSCRAMM family adhesin SdrC [Chitinophagaceae bacterium]|nr:MSCRAMM family adhesin SdrC [Chitinophagaceae bacterium]
MTDKLFDEFVKGKLGQHDSGAPMQVWERIREKEKDDRKGFFFFRKYWLTAVALLGLTGMLYLTWDSVVKHESADKPAVSSAKQHQKTESKQTETPALQSKEQTIINPEESTTNTNSTDQKEGINNTTENTVKENTANPQGIKNGTAVPANKEADSHQLNGIKNNSGTVVTNRYQSNQKTSIQKQQMNVVVGNMEQQTTSTDAKEMLLRFTAPAAYRYSLSTFRLGNVPQRTVGPACPSVNGPRRNDLYLEVYGSPDFTMRSFSNPGGFNNYISQRRASEDNRNGFSAGVRIAKNIGEQFVLKAGVNYSQINERLRIVNENQKQTTQIITTRTVIRAPGDTLFIRDTTYFEQTGTRYRTTYNRYRFIDIPVIFSYEFGSPEILAFSINAGPVFNITSFYRGEVLDTTFSPVKISTARGNGPNHWRNNIGIGVFASFAVYKRMNERLQIFAEPYFRYNFKPVTQNASFVNQRYSTTGMQLGIRYNLFSERQRYR